MTKNKNTKKLVVSCVEKKDEGGPPQYFVYIPKFIIIWPSFVILGQIVFMYLEIWEDVCRIINSPEAAHNKLGSRQSVRGLLTARLFSFSSWSNLDPAW